MYYSFAKGKTNPNMIISTGVPNLKKNTTQENTASCIDFKKVLHALILR
jgi:hypothetical protein